MKKYYPQNFITRKKQGFSVPLRMWLSNELKDIAEGVLFDTSFKRRGYFNMDFVRKIWNDTLNGKIDYSQHIWALLILEMWHQRFIDRLEPGIS